MIMKLVAQQETEALFASGMRLNSFVTQKTAGALQQMQLALTRQTLDCRAAGTALIIFAQKSGAGILLRQTRARA